MVNNEAALAAKLAALVVPNWPFVQGTDISVLDMMDCARRGTREQQQVAKQARETMAQIMDLEEDAPVRLLLDNFCRPAERASMDSPLGAEEVRVLPTRQGPQLPNELVLRVLHFLLPDDDWTRDIEIATLGCVRAVSKSIKHLAETRFPNTLNRYVWRIVRMLLHGQGSPILASRLAHASAPLFKRCKELQIWVAGDEVETLNNLLEVFESMEKLVVYVTSDDAIFSCVELEGCRSLRCVQFRGINPSAPPWESDDDDRRHLGDTFINRPVDSGALDFYRGRSTSLRRGHVRLELAYSPFDPLKLYRSLGSMDEPKEIKFFGDATAVQVKALRLCKRYGPSKLEFWGEVDEEALEILAVGQKADLKELFLRGLQIIDPAVLGLKTNKSLIRLSPGSLLSANLDLGFNKHLRHLDLFCSLGPVEGSIVAALHSLGAQLALNSTLEVLKLGHNAITDKGALALRLSENQGLKKLSFVSNMISDAGLRAALDGNTALTMVDVRSNEVTDLCAEEMSGVGRRVIVRTHDCSFDESLASEEWE